MKYWHLGATPLFKTTKEKLIDFEKRMATLFDEGDIPHLLHLSGGNEDELIDIFSDINEGDYIFSTHRNHYHYLLSGGSEKVLEEEILKGNSMFIYDNSLNFFTSSIVAGNCGIAVGVAESLKRKNSKQMVYCFVGDGAEDEGHFYESVRYSASAKLPCKFIIEDNNRSVNASKEERNSKVLIDWPDNVIRYNFKPTYPHAGSGSGKWVNFKCLST